MISMYKWHQVRVMREKGAGVKEIARRLGISKNTVRKYLRSSGPPRFEPRQYEKKIDPYREQVREMLGKGYIGTRIYDELKQIDYPGSLAGVHRYIHECKEQEEVKKASTTRFETPPGQQMQYDWKEWVLPVGGNPLKIYLHKVVLSYSRLKHYSFSLSIVEQDVIRAIEAALFFFGGTARELLIDNPKQMVVTHRRDGVVCYNEGFLRFCGLYGIDPNACRPYRARTKGKVERPFYYIQEHLLRGLGVDHLEEFDQKLEAFRDEYNRRPHSSLGEPPLARFEREKGQLKPLPAVEPTVLYDREIRRVSNDGYISYRGGFYPVPMRLCLQEVWVECVFGRRLLVYDPKGMLVSEQEIRLFDSGKRPEHPEHETINQAFQKKREQTRSVLVQRFIALFGETGQRYVAGFREGIGANLYWHLSEILTCCELYDPQEVKRVLEVCQEMGSYHKNSVLRLLDPSRLKPPILEAASAYERWPRQEITRPLSVYASLKEVSHE